MTSRHSKRKIKQEIPFVYLKDGGEESKFNLQCHNIWGSYEKANMFNNYLKKMYRVTF